MSSPKIATGLRCPSCGWEIANPEASLDLLGKQKPLSAPEVHALNAGRILNRICLACGEGFRIAQGYVTVSGFHPTSTECGWLNEKGEEPPYRQSKVPLVYRRRQHEARNRLLTREIARLDRIGYNTRRISDELNMSETFIEKVLTETTEERRRREKKVWLRKKPPPNRGRRK